MSAAATPIRVGLLLPSTNVTLETELPALLGRHQTARFSFHSSRVRPQPGADEAYQALPLLTRQRTARLTFYGSRMQLHSGWEEALRARRAQRERGVAELLDTSCQVLLDGCLAALLAQGPGAHHQARAAIREQVRMPEAAPVIVTSVDALLEALQALFARRVALVMPAPSPLAEQLVAYLAGEQLEVTDWVALEEANDAAVACISGERILAAARTLDLPHADALVLSADGQMPTWSLIELAEAEFGLPVASAATVAAFTLLRQLHLPTVLPNAGRLLRRDTWEAR